MRIIWLVATLTSVLVGDAVNAGETDGDVTDSLVTVERDISVAAYPTDGQIGDKGARIGYAFLVDRWVVMLVASGEIVEPSAGGPFAPVSDLGKQRWSRIMAVDLRTGKKKSLVVSGRFVREAEFTLLSFVDRQTVETQLRGDEDVDDDQRWAKSIQWDLKTDDIRVLPSAREPSSSIALMLNSAGLSLESLTDKNMTVKDRSTELSSGVPLKEKPSTGRPFLHRRGPSRPRTIVGPGSSKGRIIVYESPEEGEPSVAAYEPTGNENPVWQISATAIERRCSKNGCLAVIPAENTRFPCETLPLLAFFHGWPPSLVATKGGVINWTWKIPFEHLSFMIASENERFVAVPGYDGRSFSTVCVDCEAKTAFEPIGETKFGSFGVAGITNQGELILTKADEILVCTFAEGEWKRKTIEVLVAPDPRSD